MYVTGELSVGLVAPDGTARIEEARRIATPTT